MFQDGTHGWFILTNGSRLLLVTPAGNTRCHLSVPLEGRREGRQRGFCCPPRLPPSQRLLSALPGRKQILAAPLVLPAISVTGKLWYLPVPLGVAPSGKELHMLVMRGMDEIAVSGRYVSCVDEKTTKHTVHTTSMVPLRSIRHY